MGSWVLSLDVVHETLMYEMRFILKSSIKEVVSIFMPFFMRF